MGARAERSAWVSYLRVSTPEQADRELSLPAQRRAVEDFAARHGATIAREYVEAGCSGANPHRPVFRRMLEDVLRPGSDVATIVVHHTSRFTRNSTEARVVKSKLRRIGVRVVSTSHELSDDPIGKLMEGLLECFDQYESEINGVRTAAAMAEAVRQGYFPGARTPFGYRTATVEPRPGLVRHVLEPVPGEVAVVREIYRMYIALGGAKAVARELNRREIKYRTGVAWTKDLVLHVIEQTAAIGTYYWGKRRANRPRPREEWLPLVVTPVVDRDVYELAQRLRRSRDPSGGPGKAAARQHLLTGKLRCGRCGASYQLETSGKRVDGEVYRYCYYNCRNALRSGVEVCGGFRIPTEALDAAVLEVIADQVCARERVQQLVQRVATDASAEDVARAWRSLVTTHPVVGRSYVMHLVEHIEVHLTRIVLVPTDAQTVIAGSPDPFTSAGPTCRDSSGGLESAGAAPLRARRRTCSSRRP
jgi:DNA invertase Pin-like site-specific DNA recombinase